MKGLVSTINVRPRLSVALILLCMFSCGGGGSSYSPSNLKINIIVSEHKPLVFFATQNQFPISLSARLDNNDTSKMIVEGYFKPAVELPELVEPPPPETNDDNCVFSDYGAYYLKTNKGNFKILLLPEDDTSINKVITVFDFVCQNSVFGHIHQHNPASKNVDIFFYTDYPISAICYDTTILFNTIIERVFNYTTRIGGIAGNIASGDAFWGHNVSEIKVRDKWIFFDALFAVMAFTSDGNYCSLLDTYKAINDGTVKYRHVVPKDLETYSWTHDYHYDYRNYYNPLMVEHIFIQWDPYITPLMITGIDYTTINAYLYYTVENYISLTEYAQKYY